MRAAVLAVCAAAVLLQGANASASKSWGLSSKITARKASEDPCGDVIYDIANCVTQYSSGAGDGDVIMANCCPKVNNLGACGTSVFEITSSMMERAGPTSTQLQAIQTAFEILNWCPRTGTSSQGCTDAIAAKNTCITSPPTGSGSAATPPDCCQAFSDEIAACLGQPTGTAQDKGPFWSNLEAEVAAFPTCQPFPVNDCQMAAYMLDQCYVAVQDPSNEMTNSDCCQAGNFFDMFCTNYPAETYQNYLNVGSTFMSDLANCHNGGGGGSGSHHGSGTGGNSNCDWSRQAPGFQWYSTNQGGFIVTNNPGLGVMGQNSVYYDGMQYWYQADSSRIPGLWKLSPIGPDCYSSNPTGGGGSMGGTR